MSFTYYTSPGGLYVGFDKNDGSIITEREVRTYTGNQLDKIEKYSGGATGITASVCYKYEIEFSGDYKIERYYNNGVDISKKVETKLDYTETKYYNNGVDLSYTETCCNEICEITGNTKCCRQTIYPS